MPKPYCAPSQMPDGYRTPTVSNDEFDDLDYTDQVALILEDALETDYLLTSLCEKKEISIVPYEDDFDDDDDDLCPVAHTTLETEVIRLRMIVGQCRALAEILSERLG